MRDYTALRHQASLILQDDPFRVPPVATSNSRKYASCKEDISFSLSSDNFHLLNDEELSEILSLMKTAVPSGNLDDDFEKFKFSREDQGFQISDIQQTISSVDSESITVDSFIASLSDYSFIIA